MHSFGAPVILLFMEMTSMTQSTAPTVVKATLVETTMAYSHWQVVTEFGIVALKHDVSGPVRERRWKWVAPDGTTHRDGEFGYVYGHTSKSSALAGIRRWVNATRRGQKLHKYSW